MISELTKEFSSLGLVQFMTHKVSTEQPARSGIELMMQFDFSSIFVIQTYSLKLNKLFHESHS